MFKTLFCVLLLGILALLFAISPACSEEKTYRIIWEKQMDSARVPQEAKEDQRLVEGLIGRMSDSVVFCNGSNDALYQGNIQRLNPLDYTQKACFTEEAVLIPRAFLAPFFSALPKGDPVDLTALCTDGSGYTLLRTEAAGKELAILTPADCPAFDDPDASDGHYTNAEYIARMAGFFTEGIALPRGNNNVEATRQVVIAHEYPSNATDCTREKYMTAYSPAINTLIENGQETIYLSYEATQVQYFAESASTLRMYKSMDRGATWEFVAEEKNVQYQEPFVVDNQYYIYCLDFNLGYGTILRLEENDFKRVPLRLRSDYALRLGPQACNILIHEGVVYIPVMDGNVVWARTDSDLLKARSWSYVRCGDITLDWFQKQTGTTVSLNKFTGMEGNTLLTPDGQICNLLRIDGRPMEELNGRVGLIRYTNDLTQVDYTAGDAQVVEMPTTPTKFTVSWDEKTGLYISFTALPTMGYDWNDFQRNVIVMTVSENLVDWEIVDVVLSDPAMMNEYASLLAHGYNYVDWTISGDDILLAVREATGQNTNVFHDGTYLTTYRIADYADFIAQRRTGTIYHRVQSPAADSSR